jgi:hypothetical protein
MAMEDLEAEAEAGDTLAEDISVALMLVAVILARGYSLEETMGSPVVSLPTYIVKSVTDMAGLMDSAGFPGTG